MTARPERPGLPARRGLPASVAALVTIVVAQYLSSEGTEPDSDEGAVTDRPDDQDDAERHVEEGVPAAGE